MRSALENTHAAGVLCPSVEESDTANSFKHTYTVGLWVCMLSLQREGLEWNNPLLIKRDSAQSEEGS